MYRIIRRDHDGTIDLTLATDYNDSNLPVDELAELCVEWTQEDNDGTTYALEDTDTWETVVVNEYGVVIPAAQAANYMDADLVDSIEWKCVPTEQAIFDEYCNAHAVKYGEPFELAKPNPVF